MQADKIMMKVESETAIVTIRIILEEKEPVAFFEILFDMKNSKFTCDRLI